MTFCFASAALLNGRLPLLIALSKAYVTMWHQYKEPSARRKEAK